MLDAVSFLRDPGCGRFVVIMHQSARKPKPPVVALLIETSNAFSREVLHGIRDWMRANTSWTIHLSEQGRGNKPPAWLKAWRGHGIIARVENVEIAKAVRQCGVPVVNVSASGVVSDLPTVISDSAAIAAKAWEHLRERGFRQFAFCGDGRFAWSGQHGKNFAQCCARESLPCAVFPTQGAEQEHKEIERWLRRLPKPAGILACYDIRAQQVLDACRRLGLRVPDEVAVIGQHNDELLCELCDPPLSSVIPAARAVGEKAAWMLQELMKGKRLKHQHLKVAPLGIATRLSTDTVAVRHPGLATALRHLRDHACEALRVDDLATLAGLSRSLFERMFRRELGVSPYEHLLRLRMARAEALLNSTSLPVAEIAERTGFTTVEHFSATFSRRMGRTPGSLRK